MNDLIPIEHKNQRVLTTQQVASGYETETQIITNNYNRNKERYIQAIHFFILEGAELQSLRATNQIDLPPNVNKIFLWTEKGCLLHAKSLNTDKAWEVYQELVDTYFRKQLPQPQSIEDLIIMQAQSMKQLREEVHQVKENIEVVRDTLAVVKEDWRKWVRNTLGKIAYSISKDKPDFEFIRSESYKLLEQEGNCKLEVRLNNLKGRLALEGASKSKLNAIGKIDAIEDEPRLKRIYTSIIEHMAIKHMVKVDKTA